ncbi:PhzF family phenazine biosynthesis protein [Actinosynnema sp. NPDC047251]|uniref:Phenazine biosynthesis protein, PhzF family n=1 Tax=Saccharothrix espanaensis (strain ATCC 51144 / DSM 44229 / JCM 9112 / NBRC 15066 / NRRL 15764) TaxID=1179773 RepID=K0JTS6_SACES|nr:PhzF family phenazine biosynthesis protein [Saccharothrix espanaensis]CCH28219.1 Phenazine biosynthesis protein, PhzF family [Saccharothrix espanaensis DSM 44229]
MLNYDVLDVFTDRPFAGNQLAVVHNAEELSDRQMQAVAQEFGYSETAFPLPPTDPAADYRLRIFTPITELPFAGHPSIGTAWLLGSTGGLPHGPATQQTARGLHRVVLDAERATLTGDAPVVGDYLDAGPLAGALGLFRSDVYPHAEAGVAGAGLDFTFLPVRADAVTRAVPRADLAEHVVGRGLVAVSFVDGAAHVRMFRRTGGEDPATGSAALALGVWLADRGLLHGDGEHNITVRQGEELRRPSTLDCTVTTVGGVATHVAVGGRVVPVAHGQIRVP